MIEELKKLLNNDALKQLNKYSLGKFFKKAEKGKCESHLLVY